MTELRATLRSSHFWQGIALAALLAFIWVGNVERAHAADITAQEARREVLRSEDVAAQAIVTNYCLKHAELNDLIRLGNPRSSIEALTVQQFADAELTLCRWVWTNSSIPPWWSK